MKRQPGIPGLLRMTAVVSPLSGGECQRNALLATDMHQIHHCNRMSAGMAGEDDVRAGVRDNLSRDG